MCQLTHYNHENWEQLELLVEYVKDGRNVTGENGLRIVLDDNHDKQLCSHPARKAEL
ncbi:hypothetical protein [Marinobacter sp. HL-58]|uniref:hypothetical protein n=1 Tax=Marinobacter sp. HL-58 TaxID=1479237 RepID=UPI0006DA3606|nr:hypothetical protein [Marinobacter sp. HL-58]KPP97391.1 MAG: hypothetical protein HLUCCO03_01515 [Marinobacter sp. HL-58]